MKIYCILLIMFSLSACVATQPQERRSEPASIVDSQSGGSALSASKPLPVSGKVKLMIGQDLESIAAYVNSGRYPVPAGVSTYLSFYNLMKADFPAYGALGEDATGNAVASVDWGAGPLNARLAAKSYPHSALVIGLNIAEGNNQQLWVPGGLAAIAAGKYDVNIRRLATFCKKLKRPVYLRVGYEFDGAWNRGYEKPQQYIAAYRRIVDVMNKQGVMNVAYVWQASASPVDDVLDGRRENIKQWYPGDRYVDWLGLSWFDMPDRRYRNAPTAPTQRELADEVLQLARAKQKPVMIAEAAPQGFDLSALTVANRSPLLDGKAGKNTRQLSATAIWQQWFVPLLAYVRNHADVIGAIVYINADWDSQPMWNVPYHNGYWGDTRVQANAQISRYWLQEISDSSLWLHGDK